MSQDSTRSRRNQLPESTQTTNPTRSVTQPIVLLLVVCIATAGFSGCDRTSENRPTSSPVSDSDVTNSGSTDAMTDDDASAQVTDSDGKPEGEIAIQDPAGDDHDGQSGMETLQGRWQRTDGDYILEITSIDKNGDTQAGYFNPQPIHVAKAKVQQDGETLTLFVELRDAGYPGCLYQLTYFPQQDGLAGVYFQAAQQQKYEVMFVRAQ